mgnify:CR=1 FL=1
MFGENASFIKSVEIDDSIFQCDLDCSKKYLLQFRNDFCMGDLEDLTLYKDDEMKFYSCTHEGYNSIEIDYKDMRLCKWIFLTYSLWLAVCVCSCSA